MEVWESLGFRREGSTVTVTDGGESRAAVPLGSEVGTLRVTSRLTPRGIQNAECLCGGCGGLTYECSPSVLLRFTGSFDQDRACSFGSGHNWRLSPGLPALSRFFQEMGAKTAEDALLAAHRPPGSLLDPSQHPEWEKTYGEYNKWGKFLGIPGYMTTDELLLMLRDGTVDRLLEWLKRWGVRGNSIRDLCLLHIGDCMGCMDSLARRAGVSLGELLERLASMTEEARRQLLDSLAGQPPQLGPSRPFDDDDSDKLDGTLADKVEALNGYLRIIPSGYNLSLSVISDAVRRQVMQHLWRALVLEDGQLEECLGRCLPELRQEFESTLREVKRLKTGDRLWMTAYAAYYFARAGNRWGINMSEGGCGKSATVFAIAKEIGARNILVLATKNTVDTNFRQWRSAAGLEGEERQNMLVCQEAEELKLRRRGRNYVFVTEYTVQALSEKEGLRSALESVDWDLVVCDEAQRWSGTGGEVEEGSGKRVVNLASLVGGILRRRPGCRRYLMTATPIRVCPKEITQVLEAFSGESISAMVGRGTGLSPLLKLRYFAHSHGFRFYVPPDRMPSQKEIALGRSGEATLLDDPEVPCVVVAEYEADIEQQGTAPLPNERLMVPCQCRTIEGSPELMRLLNEAHCPLFYTHFVDAGNGDSIPAELKAWVESRLGRKAITFTGSSKPKDIEMKGRKGPIALLASSPVLEGLDGLHRYSDTLFILGAPWHFAAVEQLCRRVRRQRSAFKEVACISMVASNIDYHQERWENVRRRKALCDGFLDGEFGRVNSKRLEEEYRRRKGLLMSAVEVATKPAAERQAAPRREFRQVPTSLTMEMHKFLANSRSVTTIAKRRGDLIVPRRGKPLDLAAYAKAIEEWDRQQGDSGTFRHAYAEAKATPSTRIASLGCGTSEPAYARREGMRNVTFVDPLLPEAFYASYPEVLRRDRNDTGLAEGSFDLVLSFFSMFAKDYRRSLEEMARLLAPKGRMVIMESYQSTSRGGKSWVRKGIGRVLGKMGFDVRVDQGGQPDAPVYRIKEKEEGKMSNLRLEVKQGQHVLSTCKGTEILSGVPRLVKTKFGIYLVFPKRTGRTGLEPVAGHHRVYREYRADDGSRAKVYRQVKTTPDGILKAGEWHVDAFSVEV